MAEKEPIREVLVPHPSPQLAGKDAKSPRFVPESEAVKMVESGQASWPTGMPSFREQLLEPLVEVHVPNPSPQLGPSGIKAVKFVPKHQAESMVKTGEAQWPDKK